MGWQTRQGPHRRRAAAGAHRGGAAARPDAVPPHPREDCLPRAPLRAHPRPDVRARREEAGQPRADVRLAARSQKAQGHLRQNLQPPPCEAEPVSKQVRSARACHSHQPTTHHCCFVFVILEARRGGMLFGGARYLGFVIVILEALRGGRLFGGDCYLGGQVIRGRV